MYLGSRQHDTNTSDDASVSAHEQHVAGSRYPSQLLSMSHMPFCCHAAACWTCHGCVCRHAACKATWAFVVAQIAVPNALLLHMKGCNMHAKDERLTAAGASCPRKLSQDCW